MSTLLRTAVAALAVALALPAEAAASTLKITTDPPGAAVQVDGVAYGPAPVAVPRLSPGTHELRVSADGYVTRVDTLEVAGGEDLEIHAPLSPAPKLVAPTPRPAAAQTPALPPQVQLPPPPPPPAPQPAAQPIARPSPPAPAAAAPLAPLPVSQLPIAWGTQKKSLTLRVDTVPAGAQVQVVGLPGVKAGPAVFTGFSPGTVTLLVRAPGYADKKVAVDLSTDSRTLVTLEPESR